MANVRMVVASRAQAIEVNSVLRSTYLLLSAILGFSAVVTMVSIAARVPYMGFFPYLIGFFGLTFIVHKTAHSVWGLFWTFVYAGFLGVAMAPILAIYLNINPMLVVQALALTASTFVGLSLYTIVRKADFSWLGQFIFIAMMVILGVIVLSFFVDMSPLSIVLSAFMVIVCCALILWQTSAIVLGGERNYIIAAVSLFTSIYILFMNLLSLLSIFGGEE